MRHEDFDAALNVQRMMDDIERARQPLRPILEAQNALRSVSELSAGALLERSRADYIVDKVRRDMRSVSEILEAANVGNILEKVQCDMRRIGGYVDGYSPRRRRRRAARPPTSGSGPGGAPATTLAPYAHPAPIEPITWTKLWERVQIAGYLAKRFANHEWVKPIILTLLASTLFEFLIRRNL